MKFIAVFLILNMLLLSSFSGIAHTPRGIISSCTVKKDKNCCKHDKQRAANDCARGNCNALLSCGTCGFIVIQPVSFSAAVIDFQQQPVHLFITGALSDYHGNGWNPPKD